MPATASRLRLCATGWYTNLAFAPLDAVDVERAAAVLQVLSAQPRVSDQRPCTADLGPDFLLVAETDGQPPVVMVLQLYGCQKVGIQDAARSGAKVVLDAFKTQLSAQRAASRYSLTRPGPLCGALSEPAESVMNMDPAAVTGGRLCRYPPSTEQPEREVSLDPDLARRIGADISAHSTTPITGASCPNGLPTHRLALTNADGDVLLITETCSGWQHKDGTAERGWTPSARIAKELNNLG